MKEKEKYNIYVVLQKSLKRKIIEFKGGSPVDMISRGEMYRKPVNVHFEFENMEI